MKYFLVGLIAAAGSLVQSSTGFGYAIICMALWPLFISFLSASIIEAITAFAMVVYITVRLRRHINFKLLLWPTLSSMLMSTFGILTLMSSTETLLRRILGFCLMLLSVYFIFFSRRIHIRTTRRNGLIAGVISGYCGGLFNVGGPPMVVYFLSVIDDKLEYNATLQCYFCVTTIYIFFVHLLMGNVNAEVMRFGTAALFGLAAGISVGFWLFRRLTMTNLKNLVYGFMILAGLYLAICG
jgi:uncharacterized membrane protein YfcA